MATQRQEWWENFFKLSFLWKAYRMLKAYALKTLKTTTQDDEPKPRHNYDSKYNKK